MDDSYNHAAQIPKQHVRTDTHGIVVYYGLG